MQVILKKKQFVISLHPRLERQMRELKEEMAALSRQEDEHKKRKLDSVSIGCLNASRIKQANFLFTCVEWKGNG